jgi:3D-(3,5/4)-trihydroxycyclohexane-1,2-dione acylhydrolase (decyclizing)
MTGSGDGIGLTVAQAIVRWLRNRFIEIDGVAMRICGGGFGIFGHGNVPSPGGALYPVRDQMPLYRGQNDQSMGLAAACAKPSARDKHSRVRAGRAGQRQGI